MLRHVVLFKLKEDAPKGTLALLKDELGALSKSIPEIRAYDYGSDLGLRDGNFDLCLVAQFDDAEAFNRYVIHPDHQRFVSDCLTPVAADRVAVQFEV